MDLLPNALSWLGIFGDCDSVVLNRSDNDRLLQPFANRRVASCTLSGLGELCERIEFHDLETECLKSRLIGLQSQRITLSADRVSSHVARSLMFRPTGAIKCWNGQHEDQPSHQSDDFGVSTLRRIGKLLLSRLQ